MSADQLKILDSAVLADDGGKADGTLNTSLLGQRRIDGNNFLDKIRGLHIATDANARRGLRLGRRRRRRRRGRGDRTDNSADDATGRATGNTAGNTAHNTSASGHLLFLNHCDLFGDLLGRDQFIRIELARSHFNDLNGRGSRRRGRRWRRRRRRNQKTGQSGLRQSVGIDERNQNQNADADDFAHEGKYDRPTLVCLSYAVHESLFEHKKSSPVTSAGTRSAPSHYFFTTRLPGGGHHGNGGPLLSLLYEALPEYQNWTGNENRRVGTHNDPYHQRERKAIQHLPTEQIERQCREESKAGGQHSPAQRLVDALIDQRFQRLTAEQLEVFANAIEDHNRVVHGVTNQCEQSRDHRKVDLLVEN